MATSLATRRSLSGRLARAVRALAARQGQALALALQGYFRRLAKRVVARFLARQSTLKQARAYEVKVEDEILDLLLAEDEEALRRLLLAALADFAADVSQLIGPVVGAEGLVATDPRLLALVSESSSRVAGITEGTREAIRETLRVGAERNYSGWQIANGVAKDGFAGLRAVVAEIYKGRAETIARTELAMLSQRAAHDRYNAAGVTEVEVWDGEDCGLTRHDDPEKPNGKRYPIGIIEQYPIAHPNCRRVSIPVLPER